jgi:hypothetical protein
MKRLLVVALIVASCASTKNAIKEDDSLNIMSITVQRVVPGVQEDAPYQQLKIRLEKEEGVELDSVYHGGRVFYVTPSSKAILTLVKSNSHSDTSYTGSPSSAFIFYHQKRKKYYQHFEGVERLHDLVMP